MLPNLEWIILRNAWLSTFTYSLLVPNWFLFLLGVILSLDSLFWNSRFLVSLEPLLFRYLNSHLNYCVITLTGLPWFFSNTVHSVMLALQSLTLILEVISQKSSKHISTFTGDSKKSCIQNPSSFAWFFFMYHISRSFHTSFVFEVPFQGSLSPSKILHLWVV